MDLLLGDWSSFCHSLCLSFWLTLGFTIGGGVVTVAGVHPARRSTSPRGVLPDGLGDGVGGCHDAAIFQKEGLFYFPLVHFRRCKLCFFLKEYGLLFLYAVEYDSN